MRQHEHESSNLFEKLKQRADLNNFESAIKRIINDELEKRREWFIVTYEGLILAMACTKSKQSMVHLFMLEQNQCQVL